MCGTYRSAGNQKPAAMNPNVKYSYSHFNGTYEIFKWEGNIGTKTGEWFTDKEEARKRVYELNGWKYSNKSV